MKEVTAKAVSDSGAASVVALVACFLFCFQKKPPPRFTVNPRLLLRVTSLLSFIEVDVIPLFVTLSQASLLPTLLRNCSPIAVSPLPKD